MEKKIVVALAGNPNVGKSTLFNHLTGENQHIGNYPGVTVECKRGVHQHGDAEMQIVDLPGTYSLTAYSAEELTARNFIIKEKPDVVVDIIDASNFERNLYLSVQLKELGVPLVLVFNMSDVAKARGYEFDLEKLSMFFGARIVQTVGHKGIGAEELLNAIVATAKGDVPSVIRANRKDLLCSSCAFYCQTGMQERCPRIHTIHYGEEIENEIAKIETLMKNEAVSRNNTRWLAIKLLENDRNVLEKIHSPIINDAVEKSAALIKKTFGESPENMIASRRYGFISGACKEAVRFTDAARQIISDHVDTVLTHHILGLPIFLALMYGVFYLTFKIGDTPMEWIEQFFTWLGVMGGSVFSSHELLKSLFVDGIIGGVGSVVIFLPNILLLFFAIAILEDSGYMARAAFLMDRWMHKIGLHGKSFIPMLIGFGCSVPAIMATRTLENRRDRLATMLVIPLMSCGARLPIYTLIIPAFFPQAWHAPILWLIYIIGIIIAIISVKILRSTILKGESIPLVMELPPYRMPTLKGILLHLWKRTWLYLRKAGTLILGVSILLWILTTFPKLPRNDSPTYHQEALSHTIAGRIGHFIEPILKPMGFDWKIGTALIGAFAAKEVFVAQMGIVHAVDDVDEKSETLREKIKAHYTPLTGFCIMLFCLISTPCMATIAITYQESGSWKWAFFQLVGLTALAYALTTLVFQIGSLFGV
ncbi:MAG: ferrous iron transport protein B [Verrucomicrobiota bacterium]